MGTFLLDIIEKKKKDGLIEEHILKEGKEYFIKEDPLSLSEPLLKLIARSVNDYYAVFKNASYSPKKITPNKAEKLYHLVIENEKKFQELVKSYSRIKGTSHLLNQIYNDYVGIVEELHYAKDYLSKLKDSKIHKSLLDTVNRLEVSTFLDD